MLNLNAPLPLKDASLFREANFIGGKWVEADNGQWIEVKNPATGALVGRVPAMGQAETRRAIEAAHAAQPAWRKLLASERAAILRKLFNLMLENADDLAVIMTAEQGKPVKESRGEIVYAASFIEWFAEEGKRVYGDTIPQNAHGRRIIVQKEPIGVFAAITPWNFSAAMITRKAGPGWAAGCTGLGPGGAGRAGGPARRRLQRDHRPERRDRRGADRQPAGAQTHFYGFHGGRLETHRAMRPDGEKALDGAGRQRAVHRVRRCGPG